MSEPTLGSSSVSKLPPKPSAEFLRKLAKERLRSLRESKPETRLYEAQLAVAREHGFGSWRELAAHLNAGTRGNVRRDGDKVIIDGIEPLTWSGSDNTYLQALAKSLAVIGPAHDYVRLFGDSGLAFRLRFWADDQMTSSCPSSPVGEFRPWTDITERSIGWTMRVDTRMGNDQNEPAGMEDRLDEVKASIDAGLPILAYPKMWDMGILYGYEGNKIAIRDFHVGNTETWMDVSEMRGLFTFFEERQAVPSATTSAKAALGEAVYRWTAKPDRQVRKGSNGINGLEGAYYYGGEGYAKWIALLEKAAGMPEDARRGLLHVNFWTFISLHDARQKAAPYLQSLVDLFPDKAPALRDAADAYEQAGKLSGQVIHEMKLFPAFYRPDAMEIWTSDVRRQEAEVLTRMRAFDERAVNRLKDTV